MLERMPASRPGQPQRDRSNQPRRLRLREPWASQIGRMWPPCGRRSSCRGLSSFFNGSQSLLNAIVIRSVRLPSISEQRGGQRGHNRYTSTVGGSDPLVWVRMARTRSCGPLSLSLPPALALSPARRFVSWVEFPPGSSALKAACLGLAVPMIAGVVTSVTSGGLPRALTGPMGARTLTDARGTPFVFSVANCIVQLLAS